MELSKTWLSQLPIADITKVQPVSGGDINAAFALDTPQKRYFMKVQPQHPASFFAHEITGLKLMSQAVHTPTVIANGEINGDAYLILSWLTTGHGSQADLGRAVANLHQVTAPQFGLDEDFLGGSLPKHNQWQNNWGTFYTEQRLDQLVMVAQQRHRWNTQRAAGYQKIRQAILADSHFQTVKPSLLHGDLWSGNYLFTATGEPTLIDPDVFYGDRELDIAMTTIFGGFGPDFYTAYQAVDPLPAGFEQRLPWYQLNYLLAHLDLFGETYGPAVDRILFSE